MGSNRIMFYLACMAATGSCIASSTASAQGHDASPISLPIALSDYRPMATPAQSVPEISTSADFQDSAGLGTQAVNETEGMGSPIDVARLDALRGGDGSVDNDVILQGTVTDNSADHVLSGPNAISDGAFANAAGINTAIQNTGSNVLIQNGMVVNIQFVAPTP